MTQILVATLGGSWAVVPEVYSYLAPGVLDLFKNHPDRAGMERDRLERGLKPPDEVWVATSGGDRARDSLLELFRWWELLDKPFQLRAWQAENTDGLEDEKQCSLVGELTLRCVLLATFTAREPENVVLSLAGGRKTMSADMQLAGTVFGCKALLHAVDSGRLPVELREELTPEMLIKELPAFSTDGSTTLAGAVTPLVVGRGHRSEILDVERAGVGAITPELFPMTLPQPGKVSRVSFEACALRLELDQRLKESQQLLGNFTSAILRSEHIEGFRMLYRLPPAMINKLRKKIIRGTKHDCVESDDLSWLKAVPKADLHCHLGGVLCLSDLVEAGTLALEELPTRRRDAALDCAFAIKKGAGEMKPNRWLSRLVDHGGDWKNIDGIPVHEAVFAFLSLWKGKEKELDNLVFGELTDSSKFVGLVKTEGLPFSDYERLGDLAGSKLLQTKAAIEATARLAYRSARANNIRYLELRGSPSRYTRGRLSEEDVIKALALAFKRLSEEDKRKGLKPVVVRFIVCVSREEKSFEKIRENVVAAVTAREIHSGFVAGIDLAGDETGGDLVALARCFREAFKACMPVTIHAGEGQPEKGIWDAAYTLHADRIGHGLTLAGNERLMEKFRDRRIAVELCPSSNIQIVGFRDKNIASTDGLPAYPLDSFMKNQLLVTINTDNPLMSRTDLSREYLRAASLTEEGLSAWDILGLVKSGFKASFLPLPEKEDLIKEVDEQVYSLILANTPAFLHFV